MKSFKNMMEAHFTSTADYRVTPSGRKVHKMKKIADDPSDLDHDGDVDADDRKLAKARNESTELKEYESKDGVYKHQAKAGRYGGSEKESDYVKGPSKKDLEKIEKEKKKPVAEDLNSVCKVCGQTPCNCTSIDEAVTVKKHDYSWGKMVTVHHGSSTSYPLHPEHQKKIASLKHGEKTSFKDETGSTVHAERENDNVHLSSKNTNKKTTVAHSHFTESVNKSDVPAFLRKKNGDKLTLKDLDKERTQNRSHPDTIKKINGTQKEEVEVTEQAPVAPVPDKKYIKGTPEWKANKEKNKPRTGHPTNEEVELDEAIDKHEQRLLQLARLGLVDKSDVSKLRVAIDQLKADKPLTVPQRTMLLGVMTDLISLVTGDDMVFNRVKLDVQKEDYEIIEDEEVIVETKDDDWDDKNPPFDPDPPKKKPSATPGKHGSGYSTARHLARIALQKQQQKKQGK